MPTVTTTHTGTTLGHLALHHRPGDHEKARRLLEILGCTLVDNGPDPGNDQFCTVLVDGPTGNYADNIMFLSVVKGPQAALEAAIGESLKLGAPDEHPVVAEYRAAAVSSPESISHLGLRYARFEDLERVLLDLERETGPGGALEGRITLKRYTARPNLDADLDARIAGSPAFSGDESPCFANYWIQCFVHTDLCGFGLLSFGHTFELDYVAEGFFAEPPSFGKPKPKA